MHIDDRHRYWAWKNAQSMDGLPGMKRAVETAKREHVEPIKKMVGPHAPSATRKRLNKSRILSLVMVSVTSFFLGVLATLVVLHCSPQAAMRSFSFLKL